MKALWTTGLICALLAVGCFTDDDDDGGGGGGGGGSGGSGGEECPPECLRAYTCAASCDAEPFNNGCCACPEGTIDTITCQGDAGGRCTIPCSGVAPDPEVAQDCYAFTTDEECTAYQATEFPYRCEWVVGPQQPCLAP